MIVTLLTDFGTLDPYVGVMKGVLLGTAPEITLVDLVHHVPPGNVASGAYSILSAYPHFPEGTIHLAVVDPGVGTDRRPLAMAAGGQRFVGPDNGLFSHVLEREPAARVVHVTATRYFRSPVSTTFHGRDIFAPVAAAMATGIKLEELGAPLDDPVRLPALRPRRLPDGGLAGRILHVDRFGNCVTSIAQADLSHSPGDLKILAGGKEVARVRRDYAGAAEGEVFAIWGSAGLLELSVNRGSAAELLQAKQGDPVELRQLRRP